MAGTIIADVIQSDQSYPSSINIASPLVVSNTINMSNGSLTGNVNFDSGTLFVDAVNDRVGIGGITNPAAALDITGSVFVRGSTNPGNATNRVVIDYNGNSGTALISANSTGGSTQMVFGTSDSGSNANRMTIDSVGRVTKPYQPAASIRFEAGSYTGGTIRDATFSSLSGTDYNIGGHMNTSTGVFTCPVAGMYLCNTIWYNGTGNNGYIGVITAKNGSTYGLFWYNDDQGYGDDSVIDSRIVQASAGDTLRVQLYGNSNDSTPTIQFQVYYLG